MKPAFFHPGQHDCGYTLVEFLIAATLGLLIIVALTSLLLHSQENQAIFNDETGLQESARYVFENISRSVKHAGYINYDPLETANIPVDKYQAAIQGFDARSMSANSEAINETVASSNNDSDILALRFWDSDIEETNNVGNCAGVSMTAPDRRKIKQPSWSIYYVANNTKGEPELFCKFRGKSGAFSAQAIATGVDAFQVLYGLPDKDMSYRFLNASEVSAMDQDIPAEKLTEESHWHTIVAVKIALLLHSPNNTRTHTTPVIHYLFGKNDQQHTDPDTRIDEAALPDRQRLRRVFSATIPLNNREN